MTAFHFSKLFQTSYLVFCKFNYGITKSTIKIVNPILLIFFFLLAVVCQAQYPYLKVELKTNLSKITCLDDFELEAKQINWQLLNQNEKKFMFQNLQFISPQKGNALAFVPGAGDYKFFVKTTNSGKSWNYDKIIKYTYVLHMQMFGKDTIILYGKRIINFNTYEYQRYRYLSINGGDSWDSIQTNLTMDQSLTYFINPKVAYCIDVNNTFFASTDGGINWEKQSEVSIGFKKDLYSPKINEVFLLNDNALYKSVDGGKQWRKIRLPIENGFSDLCLKDNIGFISGGLGRILKTEDGGETWEIVNNKLYPNLHKIEIQNKDSVFAVGNLGTILFSSNAGKNWQVQYTDNRDDLYEIQILNPQNIFIGGMYGLFKYHKPEILTGYQWEPKNLVLASNGTKATANSTNDAWIRAQAQNSMGKKYTDSILIDIDAPAIFLSSDTVMDNTSKIGLHALTDAGTWSLQKEEFVMVVYHDLERINGDTLIIGGQYDANGVILKSTDGGNNWFHVNQNIDYRIDDIEFTNSKIGYAGGYLGYLIKTIDGGDHWEKLVSPTSEDIKSISFVSQDTGYIAADRGQVYKTTDGGKTWEYHYLPYDFAFKIKFLDERNGFLIHNYSGFLCTTDGGESWQAVPHDKFYDLMDLTFVNKKVGYVTGSMLGPFLYMKTIDGGKTWMEKIFPRWTLTTYQTISFKDEYTGFVFNQLGEVITTGDGGQNWFILDTLKFNEPNTYGSYGFTINSFKYIDENTAIGVGNGQIIRYEFSPNIKYDWLPDTKVSGKNTAHPLVPTYTSKSFSASIFRDNSCGVSDKITIPQINVYVPTPIPLEIIIYPQPANDELFIRSSELPDFDLIKIFDMKGGLQYSKEIKENNGLVKIKPGLSPGMYVIEIIGQKQTFRNKISFH